MIVPLKPTIKQRLGTAQISRYCCYLCLLCLFVLFVLKNIFSPEGSIPLLFFQSFPLLIVLPGLYRNYYKAYSWLCFIVLVYFIAYTTEVGSPLREWTDYLGLGLSVLLFITAMFTSRQLQKHIL
jgi:uncharacterized membrane protein